MTAGTDQSSVTSIKRSLCTTGCTWCGRQAQNLQHVTCHFWRANYLAPILVATG